MKTTYSRSANKVFLSSIIIGLISQAILALVKYLFNYQGYAYIDGVFVLLLGISILALYIISKDILIAYAIRYVSIFLGFNIVMAFVYMLGFVDDFKSIIVGLSYVINMATVIISSIILGKKMGCLDEVLGRKN